MKPLGFLGTGAAIIKKETALGLYKGLGAVLTGIIPKMAIRFTSYEQYKQLLAKDGATTAGGTFIGTSAIISRSRCLKELGDLPVVSSRYEHISEPC